MSWATFRSGSTNSGIAWNLRRQKARRYSNSGIFVPTAQTCLRRGTWGGLALSCGLGIQESNIEDADQHTDDHSSRVVDQRQRWTCASQR
jgi:hypothetical protein